MCVPAGCAGSQPMPLQCCSVGMRCPAAGRPVSHCIHPHMPSCVQGKGLNTARLRDQLLEQYGMKKDGEEGECCRRRSQGRAMTLGQSLVGLTPVVSLPRR